MSRVHAVILAGGSGTRFWPASRRARPKQLLPLAGDGDESLIAATVRRLAPLIAPEDVWIATGEALARRHRRGAARRAARAPPRRARRRATPRRHRLGGGHHRARGSRRARRGAAGRPLHRRRAGVPRRARARPRGRRGGLAHHHRHRADAPRDGLRLHRGGRAVGEGVNAVARFVEKPDRARAEEFLAGGQAPVERRHVLLPRPRHARGHREAPARPGRGLARARRARPHGPRRRTRSRTSSRRSRRSRSTTASWRSPTASPSCPASFGWNDIGSWEVTWELARHDAERQRAARGHRRVDACEQPREGPDHGGAQARFALVGVNDLVVVETDDAVLVIPRDRAQDVRAIVDALQGERRERLEPTLLRRTRARRVAAPLQRVLYRLPALPPAASAVPCRSTPLRRLRLPHDAYGSNACAVGAVRGPDAAERLELLQLVAQPRGLLELEVLGGGEHLEAHRGEPLLDVGSVAAVAARRARPSRAWGRSGSRSSRSPG